MAGGCSPPLTQAFISASRSESRERNWKKFGEFCNTHCCFELYFNEPSRMSLLWALLFRHVILSKEIAKMIPKTRLLTEQEWRAVGVQQSRGWVHYMLHKPEPHILLFRRPLGESSGPDNPAKWSGSLLWTFDFANTLAGAKCERVENRSSLRQIRTE